jgi:hypothetical protein
VRPADEIRLPEASLLKFSKNLHSRPKAWKTAEFPVVFRENLALLGKTRFRFLLQNGAPVV